MTGKMNKGQAQGSSAQQIGGQELITIEQVIQKIMKVLKKLRIATLAITKMLDLVRIGIEIKEAMRDRTIEEENLLKLQRFQVKFLEKSQKSIEKIKIDAAKIKKSAVSMSWKGKMALREKIKEKA